MQGIKEFDITKYQKETTLIIYGAGVFGEYALKGLEQWNVTPLFICDRAKSGKKYFGIDVVKPEKLKEYPNATILIAVGLQFQEIQNYLMEQGRAHYYSIYDFLFQQCDFRETEFSLQAKDSYYYKQLYEFGMNYDKEGDQIKLTSLDFVITQRCSLRCEGCSNLMQYYRNPKDIAPEDLFASLERLLDCVEEVMDLRIIGGEPFMNRRVGEILRRCIPYRKIRNISIHTNATIVPNEDIINIMKDKKIKVEMTDYGTLSVGLARFTALLEQMHIRYHVEKWDEWQDLGRLEYRNRNSGELKTIYQNCYCNYLPTLLEGKLYICPYSAHGRELEAVPFVEEDVVDFTGSIVDGRKLWKMTRRLLYEKEYDEACNYCNGRNNQLAIIEPAIQAKAPLEYRKCMK